MKSADAEDFGERGFCPTSCFFLADVSGFFLTAAVFLSAAVFLLAVGVAGFFAPVLPAFTIGAAVFLEFFPIADLGAFADDFVDGASFDFLAVAAFFAAGFATAPFLAIFATCDFFLADFAAPFFGFASDFGLAFAAAFDPPETGARTVFATVRRADALAPFCFDFPLVFSAALVAISVSHYLHNRRSDERRDMRASHSRPSDSRAIRIRADAPVSTAGSRPPSSRPFALAEAISEME